MWSAGHPGASLAPRLASARPFAPPPPDPLGAGPAAYPAAGPASSPPRHEACAGRSVSEAVSVQHQFAAERRANAAGDHRCDGRPARALPPSQARDRQDLLLGDDLLACVMGGVYTDVEQTMIELQRTTIVQETRSIFQEAMQHRFISVVERTCGRKVLAFISISTSGRTWRSSCSS